MVTRLRDDPKNITLLDEAQTVLGRDLGELDTADALTGTEAAQIALFIAAVANARSLERNGIEAAFVAGHSVGAFAAAVIAGVVGFRDALAIVALRGHAMAHARPSGFGMAAIIGVPQSTLQTWIDAATQRGATLYLTNRNAARQFAVSGANADLDAIDRIRAIARCEQGDASRRRGAVAFTVDGGGGAETSCSAEKNFAERSAHSLCVESHSAVVA